MTTETQGTEQLEQFTYDGWAVVEVFGHRRFGAKVKPQSVGAGVFLRCDIPRRDGGAVTQFYNPTSVFSLTPCGEREAHAVAYANEPEPVSRWEMKALDAPAPRPHVVEADGFSRGPGHEDRELELEDDGPSSLGDEPLMDPRD
jgi:hypothetical protein